MLTEDFCKEMAIRYPYSLKSESQIDAYVDDIKYVVGDYQGEILGFAFNIIRLDWTRLPKAAEVKQICLKVKLQDDPKKSYQEKFYPNHEPLIKQFLSTPNGQECLKRRIARQAIAFIEQKDRMPSKEDCRHFLDVQKATDREIVKMQKSKGDFGAYIRLGEQFNKMENDLSEQHGF